MKAESRLEYDRWKKKQKEKLLVEVEPLSARPTVDSQVSKT
jgi:hypothetical protein